jgi:hypothetical protein
VSTGIHHHHQQQQQQQQQQQKDLAFKFFLSFTPPLKSKEHWDPAKTTTTTTKGLLSFFLLHQLLRNQKSIGILQ